MVQLFIDEARKTIDIDKVILFGSHALGRCHEWSDIDLAIVSDDFKDMDIRERLLLLNKISWRAKTTEIDPLGYTVAEFTSDDPLDLVTEIKQYGIVVFDKSAPAPAIP